ncbi:MAG TPA: tetratricopeptide repeat protein [Pirellulales bacterium]|nr:tetratricopeptide repeat protein [Pirellulales bacterium]
MLRFAAPLIALSLLVGCNDSAPPKASSSADDNTAKIEQAVTILDYIAGLINHPTESDAVESTSWDIIDLNEAALRALESGVAPALVPQLNQWIVLQVPLADWRREPLINTLPADLQKSSQLKELADMGFGRADGIDLRQAIWLRDASNWAAGGSAEDLERAQRIFDWIVRNIQLDPDDDAIPRQAWQTMLLGHGPAIDRAWLFALMARQQGLDVVMLATPTGTETNADKNAAIQPWLPALFHEGDFYLFEPALGLPVPGPGGQGIATLAQVAADDSLLRQLDLDDDHHYGKSSADVQNLTVLIEASPLYLSQRMALLESQLAGEQNVTLSLDASALAGRLRSAKHVADVRLWPLPYERLADQARLGKSGRQRLAIDFEPFVVPFPKQVKKKVELLPALWKARVRHLLGEFVGEDGALRYYQLSRLADADMGRGPVLTPVEEEDLRGKVTPDEWQTAVNHYVHVAPVAKHDASYWLGLIAFEQKNYKTAADHFSKRTLDVNQNSPWRSGALYNLARAQEALGLTSDAVEVYRQIESPQRHGNLLRARWLETKASPTKEASNEASN